MNRLKKAIKTIIIFLLMSLPVWAFASNDKRNAEFSIIEPLIKIQSDTSLPAKKDIEIPKETPSENSEKKPVVAVIREVPLARKQAIPVPVKVKVNPIKIIKPTIKIIKPVIKILH